MKMLTFRLTGKKIAIAAAAAAFITALIVHLSGTGMEKPPADNGRTNEQRVAYLSGLGWDVADEPVEQREFLMPGELDQTLISYNELQKKQGFDLAPYCGKLVTTYSYEVKNYRDATDYILARLYVFDGKVIAGDISSATMNGFTYGLTGEA